MGERQKAEGGELTPAQIVAMEYEGYLHSDRLDPAWVAGWHAAINHAVSRLTPPGSSEEGSS